MLSCRPWGDSRLKHKPMDSLLYYEGDTCISGVRYFPVKTHRDFRIMEFGTVKRRCSMKIK